MGELTTLRPQPPPVKELKAKWRGLSRPDLLMEAHGILNLAAEFNYVALNVLAFIEESNLWKTAGGPATFKEFLWQEFRRDETVYRKLRLVAGLYEREQYDRWGGDVLRCVSKTADPTACLKALNTAYEEGSEIIPRPKDIKDIIRQHSPQPPRVPREPAVENPAVLRKENERLRGQVKALDAEARRLDKELKEAREQLRAMRADIRDHYQRLGKAPEPRPTAPPA